jgi:hypothetical protein
MEVLLRSGSAKEQALARKILPVIADEHWLLVRASLMLLLVLLKLCPVEQLGCNGLQGWDRGQHQQGHGV